MKLLLVIDRHDSSSHYHYLDMHGMVVRATQALGTATNQPRNGMSDHSSDLIEGQKSSSAGTTLWLWMEMKKTY